jgi:hypothetical protein
VEAAECPDVSRSSKTNFRKVSWPALGLRFGSRQRGSSKLAFELDAFNFLRKSKQKTAVGKTPTAVYETTNKIVGRI